MKPSTALLLLSAVPLACRSAEPAPAEDAALTIRDEIAPARPDNPVEAALVDYTFVFLEKGPNSELSQEATAEAFAGHIANMERLANENLLLLAGPFADPKADPAHRGLFLFDVDTVAEAERLVAADPAVKAGALQGKVYILSTTSPMRDFLDHYRAAAAAGEPGMLDYVLVSTDDAMLAKHTLERRPERILFHGQFAGDRDGEWLLCLDARTKEEAHALLETGDWTYYPWWSTDTHRRALLHR